MPVFISLLRAINVGGNKIVKMDALKEVYSSLGLTHVQTHLQSGNVIFESKLADRARLTEKIGNAVEETFGLRADIVLRTTSEFREVIGNSPWTAGHLNDPSKLLVLFLAETPDAAAMGDFLKGRTGPEEVWVKRQEIYLFFPKGIGQSKLNTVLLMKKMKTSGTGRNWNTVTKLLALAEAIEAVYR